ncbi:hypothetical protein [Sphingomonas sp. TZW2008]|uniref:hypothetical protein n=1 Tax=Sphingomonas sp. TZW2008 TaxID=1917973 RepID=UPI000A26AD8C|nr:hypothetical protein [Sphingomonas sp. TZW2008]
MVAGLTGAAAARVASAAALAALAIVAPRLALLVAILASIYWVGRRDDDVGTWGVLYVVLLLILGVLTLLIAGLALIHRLVGG